MNAFDAFILVRSLVSLMKVNLLPTNLCRQEVAGIGQRKIQRIWKTTKLITLNSTAFPQLNENADGAVLRQRVTFLWLRKTVELGTSFEIGCVSQIGVLSLTIMASRCGFNCNGENLEQPVPSFPSLGASDNRTLH